LDATCRILVFEALKRWRQNKTTIVITHDLSQIEFGDFVYVLKDGRVVEQGFRNDLESVSEEEDGRGEFRKMMERQSQTGGFLPEKDVAVAAPTVDVEDVLKQQEEEEEEELNEKNEKYALPAHLKHKSIAVRPLSLGNWMFDVIADLTSTKPAATPLPPPLPVAPAPKTGRRLTIQVPSSPATESQFKLPAALPAAYDGSNRRHQSLHRNTLS
jgi:ATP-binding cassette subfamily B (MDR/TAP) protein 1